MTFLYDAIVGEPETYGYCVETYDAETGYDHASAQVSLRVTGEGKGHVKARWRQLCDGEVAAWGDPETPGGGSTSTAESGGGH